METYPGQALPVEMSVIGERLSVAARIGGSIRAGYESVKEIPRSIKTFGAVGTTALTLFVAAYAETASAESESAAGDNVPAGVTNLLNPNNLAKTSSIAIEKQPIAQFSSINQECWDAGLVPPSVIAAYMIRPGKKPYAKSPTHAGLTQEVRLNAKYEPMPGDDLATPEVESCSDYRRIGQVMLQKRVGPNEDENDHKNDGWATMDYWSWIYSRDRGGTGGLIATPNGHEGDWYYEKPGQKVRAQFRNLVKYLPTGETITSKIKTVRVAVRRPQRHTPRK